MVSTAAAVVVSEQPGQELEASLAREPRGKDTTEGHKIYSVAAVVVEVERRLLAVERPATTVAAAETASPPVLLVNHLHTAVEVAAEQRALIHLVAVVQAVVEPDRLEMGLPEQMVSVVAVVVQVEMAVIGTAATAVPASSSSATS
jgi:hypothetical protein